MLLRPLLLLSLQPLLQPLLQVLQLQPLGLHVPLLVVLEHQVIVGVLLGAWELLHLHELLLLPQQVLLLLKELALLGKVQLVHVRHVGHWLLQRAVLQRAVLQRSALQSTRARWLHRPSHRQLRHVHLGRQGRPWQHELLHRAARRHQAELRGLGLLVVVGRVVVIGVVSHQVPKQRGMVSRHATFGGQPERGVPEPPRERGAGVCSGDAQRRLAARRRGVRRPHDCRSGHDCPCSGTGVATGTGAGVLWLRRRAVVEGRARLHTPHPRAGRLPRRPAGARRGGHGAPPRGAAGSSGRRRPATGTLGGGTAGRATAGGSTAATRGNFGRILDRRRRQGRVRVVLVPAAVDSPREQLLQRGVFVGPRRRDWRRHEPSRLPGRWCPLMLARVEGRSLVRGRGWGSRSLRVPPPAAGRGAGVGADGLAAWSGGLQRSFSGRVHRRLRYRRMQPLQAEALVCGHQPAVHGVGHGPFAVDGIIQPSLHEAVGSCVGHNTC